jgi:hypothetical protein
MTWLDLRIASDLELGMSIYEPFGIAPVEPLSFGGLCLISSVCGCAGFARRAAGGGTPETVIVADFTQLPPGRRTLQEIRAIGRAERNEVEERVAQQCALAVAERLPKSPDERYRLVEVGSRLGAAMSWDVVVFCPR